MCDKIKTSAEALEATALPHCHEVHADPDREPANDLTKGATDKQVEPQCRA